MKKTSKTGLFSLLTTVLFAAAIAGCGSPSGTTDLGDLPPGASNQEEEASTTEPVKSNVPADEV